MGKLKTELKQQHEIRSNIAIYLLEAGFKYTTYVYGSDLGYQKTFDVDNGQYTTWIHVDLDKNIVNIYKEYGCGGYVASESTSIPDEIVKYDDTEAFITWLDEEAEYYL